MKRTILPPARTIIGYLDDEETKPVYMVAGGSGEDDPEPPAGDEDDDQPDDEPDDEAPSGKTWDPDRAREQLRKKNSEARNLRARLKELEPLAQKAKELEDAGKSETEKLTERVTAAEKAAADSTDEVLRLRVALRKSLTLTQAKRLVGSTEEELEADAEELLASFGGDGKSERKPKISGKPKEHLRGGGDPDEEPDETDVRKLGARMFTR